MRRRRKRSSNAEGSRGIFRGGIFRGGNSVGICHNLPQPHARPLAVLLDEEDASGFEAFLIEPGTV